MAQSEKNLVQSPPDAASMERLTMVATASGYPVQSLMLIMHAVTQARSRETARSKPDGAQLSAQAICDALFAVARKGYRERAESVLEQWHLTTSEDIGRIVVALAGAGLCPATTASEEDFRELYTAEDLPRLVAAPAGAGAASNSAERSRNTQIPSLIEQHFRPNSVQDLVVTQRTWPHRVRVDLQHAAEQILSGGDVVHFSGVRKEYAHEGLSLHEVMSYSRHANATAVPPMYEEIDIGEDQPARCLQNGLWLARIGDRRQHPIAVLMAPRDRYGRTQGMKFEVAMLRNAESAALVEEFFRTIEQAILDSHSYRGKVLSLEQEDDYSGESQGIRVHRLRSVARDEVILPERTLQLLEGNVIRFVERRNRLARLGMQVKKGLLFYGPPGTGKTHTIHYLAGALPKHTTLLITADQVGLFSEYMALARLLQPSIVVIEDADLVGRDRAHRAGPCDESMLNLLLNEMDGLREDAEILFILTTNRPEMLEPALAARPGRIDQAIEFPLPDERGREKLVRLYARGAVLNDATVGAIVRKTEGVSAAFMKELMRRAAQCRMESADDGEIGLTEIETALEEMLFTGGSLNRALLGAATPRLQAKD